LCASEARRRRPTGFALRARAQAVVKGQRTKDCEKVGSETTQEFLQVVRHKNLIATMAIPLPENA
jgi:hypothetical protein